MSRKPNRKKNKGAKPISAAPAGMYRFDRKGNIVPNVGFWSEERKRRVGRILHGKGEHSDYAGAKPLELRRKAKPDL